MLTNPRRRALPLILCALVLAALMVGCGSPAAATKAPTATATIAKLADLVPAPNASGSFCRFDSSGALTVTVKNQGVGDAASSKTEVKWSAQVQISGGSGTSTGDDTTTTPAIPAGQSVDLTFKALGPDGSGNTVSLPASLTITVNSDNSVSESNMSNNTATAQCS